MVAKVYLLHIGDRHYSVVQGDEMIKLILKDKSIIGRSLRETSGARIDSKENKLIQTCYKS